MKKLLLLFVFLLSLSSLYAQIIYEYVFHEPHGIIHAIDVNQDRFLVAAGSTESCPEGFIAYFNPSGTLFWKKSLQEYLSPATDVFFDYENNIVAAGTKSIADDLGFPDDGIYLLKLDFIGNIIFYKRLRRGYHLSEKVHTIQLPDSNYLAGVQNILFWVKSNGDSLQIKELPIDKIIDLTIDSDSTFMVLSKNRAIRLNLKGDSLSEINTQENFVALCSKYDTTWILSNQNIWLFTSNNSNPQLFPLQNITIAEGITPKQNSAGVVIWGKDGTSNTFLEFSNGNWSISNIDPVIGSNLRDAKNIGENYFFAGSDLWKDMNGGFVSGTTEGYSRTTEITSDIGIVGISVQLTAPLDTVDVIRYADTVVAYGVSGRFEGFIEVINKSIYNVKEFVLSSSRLGGFNCSEGRLFFMIDSTNIKPLETKKINIRFGDFTYLNAATPDSLNRCFFVAAPNHLFDQYPANNTICTTILTAAKNVILPDINITIFPNPASAQIQIQTKNNIQIESLQLYNSAGQEQNIFTNIYFDSTILQRGNLPSGLYWLKIQTKEGFAMKKIIFQ